RPLVLDGHAVPVRPEHWLHFLAGLHGDGTAGGHSEGAIGVQAVIRIAVVRDHAEPRVALVTHPVTVAVCLVGVGNRGAVVLVVEYRVVVDVLVASVARSVPIGVFLIRIHHLGAVVKAVAHAITIRIHVAVWATGNGVRRVR